MEVVYTEELVSRGREPRGREEEMAGAGGRMQEKEEGRWYMNEQRTG